MTFYKEKLRKSLNLCLCKRFPDFNKIYEGKQLFLHDPSFHFNTKLK